jgi:hypothetical protein
MLERVEVHISKIEIHTRTLAGEVLVQQAEEFDTGAYQYRIQFPNHLTTAAAKFFRPISTNNPLIGIAMFLVVVLNLFGHLAQPGCNFALHVLQVLVRCALEDDGNLSPRQKSVMDNFPTDIRTVRKVFDLDPTLIVYATCPQCCYTHPPTFTNNSKVARYPS